MTKKENLQKSILYIVFIFYILLLIKLLFLSRVSFVELFRGERSIEKSFNIIPFNSIKEYIFSNSENVKRFAFSNVVGNIFIFIPLGTYLLLLKKNKRIQSNLVFLFYTSLLVETIQGILGIGATDVDDLILNCFGGLVGILLYKFLLTLLKSEKKVLSVITIISLVGLPIILYLLLCIRLRL